MISHYLAQMSTFVVELIAQGACMPVEHSMPAKSSRQLSLQGLISVLSQALLMVVCHTLTVLEYLLLFSTT